MIAILGSKGQLGLELTELCKTLGIDAAGADLPEVDIADFRSADTFLKKNVPSIVVNAAAYTNVDRAESDAETAFAVNSQGPENLARICAAGNFPLIHISTDYVFDGKGCVPYTEAHPVNPLGVYGKSKEEGDRRVRQAAKNHIIIRTSWLYSPFGHNFVKTMIRLGREKKEVRVVRDQYGSPTCAADLAAAILKIIDIYEKKGIMEWGTYHFSGQGAATWHEFAEAIFENASKYFPLEIQKVIPITTDEYPTAANRPGYSVLDCTRIQRRFGIVIRPWQDCLTETVRRISEKAAHDPVAE